MNYKNVFLNMLDMNFKINPYYTVFEYGMFSLLLFNVNRPFKCQINNTCPYFFSLVLSYAVF